MDLMEYKVREIYKKCGVPTKKGIVDIFGGITRCDEVASGVKLAMEKQPEEKPILVRFEGTNKDKGFEILESIGGNVFFVNGLREGVRELAARREQL